DGKAKFACKRITYDKPSKENGFIKGDVTGSQKAVGLFIDNHASSLFLCEAPIDAMSLMTLFDLHKVDFNKYSYLAQGGVAMNALKYHLPHQPGINRIYLCYDNDDAGYIARSNAKELLHELGYKGQVIDKPPHNKDWNEDLKKLSSTFSQSKQNELSLEKSNQTLQIMKR
ncbi:MAG: toprim domain-containing protein, partial [Oscillospiraceae bacterium]